VEICGDEDVNVDKYSPVTEIRDREYFGRRKEEKLPPLILRPLTSLNPIMSRKHLFPPFTYHYVWNNGNSKQR
jgi:hypothetical protein